MRGEAILILPKPVSYHTNQESRKNFPYFSIYLKDNQLFKAKIITTYYEVYNLCRTKFISRVQRLGRATVKYIITSPFTVHKALAGSDKLKVCIYL